MLIKRVNQYGDRFRWYRDPFRHVLVHLASIEYIFLRESTDFHDMPRECRRIRLLIHLPEIARLVNPRSLKNCSPISPQFLPGLLKLLCWNYLLPQRLKTLTLLKIYPFLIQFPLQWMNLQKYCSLKILQAYPVAPTRQTFCLLCGFQRDLLVHIPPHKFKTVQTTTLIWVYFPQMTRQLLTIKTLPKC